MNRNKANNLLCLVVLLLLVSCSNRIDNGGDIVEVIHRDGKIWYDQNFVWVLVVGLLPVAFIRPMVNLKLWNKIYKTKYVLGATTFRKGETNAQFYAMLIFWWLKDTDDNLEIKREKKIANIVCLISILMAAMMIATTLLLES